MRDSPEFGRSFHAEEHDEESQGQSHQFVESPEDKSYDNHQEGIQPEVKKEDTSLDQEFELAGQRFVGSTPEDFGREEHHEITDWSPKREEEEEEEDSKESVHRQELNIQEHFFIPDRSPQKRDRNNSSGLTEEGEEGGSFVQVHNFIDDEDHLTPLRDEDTLKNVQQLLGDQKEQITHPFDFESSKELVITNEDILESSQEPSGSVSKDLDEIDDNFKSNSSDYRSLSGSDKMGFNWSNPSQHTSDSYKRDAEQELLDISEMNELDMELNRSKEETTEDVGQSNIPKVSENIKTDLQIEPTTFDAEESLSMDNIKSPTLEELKQIVGNYEFDQNPQGTDSKIDEVTQESPKMVDASESAQDQDNKVNELTSWVMEQLLQEVKKEPFPKRVFTQDQNTNNENKAHQNIDAPEDSVEDVQKENQQAQGERDDLSQQEREEREKRTQELMNEYGLAREKVIKKEIAGINTTRQHISNYLDEVIVEIMKYKDDFMENICEPINRDPLAVLNTLQSAEIGGTDLADFEQIVPPILNVELYLTIEQDRTSCFKEEDMDQETAALLTEAEHIHNKVLFDSFNLALESLRPYGRKGVPQIWSTRAHLRRPSGRSDLDALRLLNRAKRIVIDWAGKTAGTLPSRAGSIPLSEDQLVHRREERLAVLLANEVTDLEQNWVDYENEESQVKLDLADMVLHHLIDEIVLLMSKVEKYRK
eukprot:CAMPEP_0115019460 /NCGR_PEP_ID=MMETSP0216-20121206/29461_1 /TAXON_ID=223996 /ORGANISM="Protocruzia adherens, Strain Boccale" /LENGTH=707 /DNA_ID=CAMNT_0002390943 /DNA_START=14 /DNA_END=2137 /DNA_ORIENTATION=+